MCNTLQEAVRAASPTSPAETADTLMQKNTDGKTGGWTRITENNVKCFHATTASLQHTSISNTGPLELWRQLWVGPCFIYFTCVLMVLLSNGKNTFDHF